jgi:hypothetical protein
MNPEPDFRIEPPDWTKEMSALRKMASVDGAAVQPLDASAVRDYQQKVSGAFCEIAIHAWRAERRMKDKTTGEVKEDHKATHRSIAGILETLKGLGFELRDREGESYDYGLPEKVVAAEKRVGLSRELVAETIRPSIFVHGQLAWPGEIVIAVPETAAEGGVSQSVAPSAT